MSDMSNNKADATEISPLSFASALPLLPHIMPSLFSSAASGSGGLRSMSRVNSFKREWDDDEAPKANGSSSQVDWSPSPEA